MEQKHTNLWNEIEIYETAKDRQILAGVILFLVIEITLITWEPDIEAIASWIYQLIH